MSETIETIGKIHDGPLERDAIHVAVLSVVAEVGLEPGYFLALKADGFVEQVGSDSPQRIGIVDPFLTRRVEPGERFWMFMLPGSITSPRHDWTHPAINADGTASSQKQQSEAWLRKFCEDQQLGFGDTDAAYRKLVEEERLYGTSDTDMLNTDEFRFHYRIVTGNIPEYFTCSC